MSVGTQLPVDDLRTIELDEARGRLHIAQGVGGGLPLVVTDLSGRLLNRVTAVADISNLVLSDDGRILHAAQGFNRIIALDAATLTIIASYPAPPGAHLYTVEPTGEKVGGFIDAGLGSGGLLIWSVPDAQHLRHRVWCDVRLPDGGRCPLPDGHAGSCGATELRGHR